MRLSGSLSSPSPLLALAICLANSLVPERAMVPRLLMASSRLMPMPLSTMVTVRFSASALMRTLSGLSSSTRLLSSASLELLISSRRKISLLE